MVASVESLDYEAIVFDLRYDVNIAVESDDEDERALNEEIVELNSLLSRLVSETCGQRNSEIEILLKLFWDLFQRARFDEAWNVLDAIDPIDLLNDGQMINWLIYNIQFLILDAFWDEAFDLVLKVMALIVDPSRRNHLLRIFYFTSCKKGSGDERYRDLARRYNIDSDRWKRDSKKSASLKNYAIRLRRNGDTRHANLCSTLINAYQLEVERVCDCEDRVQVITRRR